MAPTSLDACLSDHAIILRSILADVEMLAGNLPPPPTKSSQYESVHYNSSNSSCDAREVAGSIEEQRREALKDFLDKKNSTVDVVRIISSSGDPCAEQVGDETEIMLTPLEFKQRYVHRNIPAIVRGLDNEGCSFHNITALWRKRSRDGKASIRWSWFSKNVGGQSIVPVRKPLCQAECTNACSTSVLDEEGRATECETIEMSMDEWIEYCQDNRASASNRMEEESRDKLYLKDWHLMQFMESKEKEKEEEEATLPGIAIERKDQSPLYFVPSIFERDILNPFLRKYFGGDFRFVYWGPASSSTALHSDVLNTFSWSFNVVGKKEWNFYWSPSFNTSRGEGIREVFNHDAQEADEDTLLLSFIQHEGEAVFVPSGWQHDVCNIEETLSVNHNWFTPASTDKVWECIMTEAKSVEDECNQWGIPSDDWDAREAMLRGCIGLNVSMYFFALLVSLVQEISLLHGVQAVSQSKVSSDPSECIFNIHRLSNQLLSMLEIPSAADGDYDEARSVTTYNTQIARRISATLMSQELANRALDLATHVVRWKDEHVIESKPLPIPRI